MRAFLSHTSSDKDLVSLVHKRLEAKNAWYDAVNIENGESIPEKINDGLCHTTHYILFWSKQASMSPWVKLELNASLVRMIEGKCKFMIFTLDDTELPPLLAHILYTPIDKSNLATAADKIVEEILSTDGANSTVSTFVNRHQELEKIETSIRSGCQVIVLSGILGIGKFSIAERALSWIYNNRATSSIVLDFSRIPGLAELSLELSRRTKADFLNENLEELQQKENIQYFLEVADSKNLFLILKDVKSWLSEDGSMNENLTYVFDLILREHIFTKTIFVTSSRYINGLEAYGDQVHSIKVGGLSDPDIASVIEGNFSEGFTSEPKNNLFIASKLFGYPLAAKLIAYRIENDGYPYYLKQEWKIKELNIGLVKELIAQAKLSDKAEKYLEIVALCKSKLRNEEYATTFPELEDDIAKLADEAFFAGIVKFNDDGCYELEPIVEDYFYQRGFTSKHRKDICTLLENFLLPSLETANHEQYLRLVPVAVHILVLNNKADQAKELCEELTATMNQSMWDQYNGMEYEAALHTADELLKDGAQNVEAQHVRALCLIRFEKYKDAQCILKTLFQKNPSKSHQYYYALGRIEKQQANYSGAIEYFMLAVHKKERYVSPYREMAECYLLMSEFSKAEENIEKAKAIDKNNDFIILLEARLAQKQGNPDLAITLLEGIVNTSKAWTQKLFRMGRAYDQLGEVQKACEFYERSLASNPKMYDAQLCLLSHKLQTDSATATEEITKLKGVLTGKRRAILTNIEARLVGYINHDEEEANHLLDKVKDVHKDRQWYAVKMQMLERLIDRHKCENHKMIVKQCSEELNVISSKFYVKYGEDKPNEFDLLPDT